MKKLCGERSRAYGRVPRRGEIHGSEKPESLMSVFIFCVGRRAENRLSSNGLLRAFRAFGGFVKVRDDCTAWVGVRVVCRGYDGLRGDIKRLDH